MVAPRVRVAPSEPMRAARDVVARAAQLACLMASRAWSLDVEATCGR